MQCICIWYCVMRCLVSAASLSIARPTLPTHTSHTPRWPRYTGKTYAKAHRSLHGPPTKTHRRSWLMLNWAPIYNRSKLSKDKVKLVHCSSQKLGHTTTGSSHNATWDHTVLPATRQRWESHLYPQPKQVLDLATREGCKAELTYVAWKRTSRELNHDLSVASPMTYCWATTQHNALVMVQYRYQYWSELHKWPTLLIQQTLIYCHHTYCTLCHLTIRKSHKVERMTYCRGREVHQNRQRSRPPSHTASVLEYTVHCDM